MSIAAKPTTERELMKDLKEMMKTSPAYVTPIKMDATLILLDYFTKFNMNYEPVTMRVAHSSLEELYSILNMIEDRYTHRLEHLKDYWEVVIFDKKSESAQMIIEGVHEEEPIKPKKLSDILNQLKNL